MSNLPAFFASGPGANAGLESFDIMDGASALDDETFGESGDGDGGGGKGGSLPGFFESGDAPTAGELLDAAMEAGDDDDEWARSREKFAMMQSEFTANPGGLPDGASGEHGDVDA